VHADGGAAPHRARLFSGRGGIFRKLREISVILYFKLNNIRREIHMAAKNKISFDKTEICVLDESGKRPMIFNLTYDKIPSIQFDHATMPVMGIFKKPTDRIMIQVRNREQPIFLYRLKEEQYFDEYITGLRKFAKENRITLHDYLAEKK
jgi:hypothetical protein